MILGYAVYIALFIPSVKELHPVNFGLFNEGKWDQQLPFEPYSDKPHTISTQILKDSAKEKFFRLKVVNDSLVYSGITFHIDKALPQNARLSMKWRGAGHTPILIIDVMDGSTADSSGTGDSTVVLGETFFLESPAPENKWSVIDFPIDTLSLNPNQPTGKTVNGIFDYNKVRQVSISISPDSDFTLDVKDLHFYWQVKKWPLAAVLLLISIIGVLLILRTTPGNLFLKSGTTLNTNALNSRVIFSLVGLSALAATLLEGPDILATPGLATYAALFILIVVDEFAVFIKPNPFWSLRYAAVLFTGYFMGFSGGILSVCLILIASYVPMILERVREIFWSVVIVSVLIYLTKPLHDSNIPFLTGLIMLIGSSGIAVILRGYLQQQHKDFLFEQTILQFEALFQNTSDAIYILDKDGIIETVNRGFERLTGYSPKELKGRPITDFVCAECKEIINDMYVKAADNEPKQYDIHFAHKNGEMRTALVRGNLMYRNNEVTGFQALATDITERKLAEEKIKQTAEELKLNKNLLERKAAELAKLNEQLKFSEVKLKELNASKDKFFSIISHDLRNPFHSLMGITDLISNDDDRLTKEEIKMFAAHIKGSVRNIYKLLENLLQWANMQRGKMVYKPGPINLSDLVEIVIGVMNGNAIEKGIKLCNNTSPDTVIYADLNSAHSVIQNLVSNAIKFTNPGGEITISSAVNGKMIEISVADNGVGMSSSDMESLFRIDIHHSTEGTAHEAGTGLGLILCKEMVEHNGGTIRVESEPGKGSRFTFTIPECETSDKAHTEAGTF